jgi:ABC-type glycerol-3-phosphate transport system substrate-binding protein
VHLTKKIAVAAGALTLAATGIAAAAGSPPEAADDGLSTAEAQVGVELPASKDAHPGAPEVQDDAADEVEVEQTDEVEVEAEAEGVGPVDNHGAEVSAVAKSDATTGRAHGEAVSEVARQGHGKGPGSTVVEQSAADDTDDADDADE